MLKEYLSRNPYYWSLLSGVFASFALPPLHSIAGIFIAFIILYSLLHCTESDKRAFIIGWCFGFGYFVSNLYWIAFALLVDQSKFMLLIPLVVTLIPGFLALYFAFAGLLFRITRKVARGNSFIELLSFTTIFTAAEWCRGHLFTGFPWNLFGYVWNDEMLQITAVIGIYGLTFITIFCATAAATLLIKEQTSSYVSYCAALIILISTFTWGSLRLHNKTLFYDDIKLRIVQPCITQSLKWQRSKAFTHLQQELAMSRIGQWQDITIWPETAVAFITNEHTASLYKFIATGKLLIFGGVRESTKHEVFNSAFVVNNAGKLLDYYDKYKLVPFGEYMPLKRFVPFKKILSGISSFTASKTSKKVITVDRIPPFGMLICYEGIFSNLFAQKAQWFINLTNDAWFGTSNGPYQHLAMVRVRAIERGKPLIRVANNGISAVIDSYGRVINSLPLNKVGIIDSKLPRPLPRATLYTRVFR